MATRWTMGAPPLLSHDGPSHHEEADDRRSEHRATRSARCIHRTAWHGPATLRHHNRNRRFRSEWHDQPQLLCPTQPHLPELRRKSWTGAHVAMGTNTDPYQRCEGRYRLTRGVLEALRDYANPCSVLTKSPLLLRDLDLFVELASTAGFSANLSIGTLDEEVWRRSEPGTPHPKARMAAVKQLVAAGIPCGILMAPILPGISDSPEQLRAVVRAAADAGASHLTPITLHLRPGVKEEFMPWLEETYPQLVPDYRRLYRGSNAPRPVREAIAGRVGAEKRRHRAFASPTAPATARRLPDPPPAAPTPASDPGPATQLSLG